MAAAVTLWSPVIIIGFIPALMQSATAAADSVRGGSIIAINPRKIRSFSSSVDSLELPVSEVSAELGLSQTISSGLSLIAGAIIESV